MALSLPSNPDLERFRRDARRLQRAVRAEQPEAFALVAAQHPGGGPTSASAFTLADAQLVVARSYGLASWPKLREFLRRSEPMRRDPTALSAEVVEADPTAAVPALACLAYDENDDPARWARAAQLIDQHPGLVAQGLAVAAAAGDADAVRAHLAADPSSAGREVGPFRWPPLLYVVYSRMPQADAVASAKLLLAAGADPDSGYLWRGLPPPFTALTGCFGEGEMGPGRAPRHPRWRELALVLLEHGADANDRQALYNRMFGRDDSHLRLLFDHGLGESTSEVWAARIGVAGETVAEMMSRQVRWAHAHGFAERVTLLAQHGFASEPHAPGGPSAPARRAPRIHRAASAAAIAAAVASGADVNARHHGRTALHQAALMGDLEVIAALLEAGADRAAVDREHGTTPLEWARWARQTAAVELLRDPPHYGGAHDVP